MQINTLHSEHLQLDNFFDWLMVNQSIIKITALAFLALVLLLIAIRLFRKGSQPMLRHIRRRSARTTKGKQQSEGLGWILIDITGQVIPIRPLPFTIGRVGGNTLALDDPSIAPRHAIIQNDPDWSGLVVEDLNSPEGILIEGLPTRKNLLHAGMHLTIGRYTFTIDQQAL